MNNCPVKSPIGVCFSCDYGKEGRCDYPYKEGMSLEQIKEATQNLKGGARLAPAPWWWEEFKGVHRN